MKTLIFETENVLLSVAFEFENDAKSHIRASKFQENSLIQI